MTRETELALTPLGGGWARVEGGGTPAPFEMRLGVTPGGRPVCIGVRVGGDEAAPFTVGVYLLKRLPITAATTMLNEWAGAQDEADRQRAAAVLDDAPEVQLAGGGPGRAGYSDEILRQTARDYAALVAEGKRHPYIHLAAALDRSETQAKRMVRQALERFPEMAPRKP